MFEVGVGATCMKPPFYAWSRSRPNLAGAGSGTSDFWSQSRQKGGGSATLLTVTIMS